MATIPDSVQIRSNWDRTLTYDCLDRTGQDARADQAIFVGREALLHPLVEAIADPETRGTFLVSGYRGAGKTTLLIEALRRAKTLLVSPRGGGEAGWTLFPLILNVSEVSASLSPASPAEPTMAIDARRLLVALLRALRNRLESTSADKDLREVVGETYAKAVASEYSRTMTTTRDLARSVETSAALAFEAKDLYRLAGLLAATGVAGAEAIAWLGPGVGSLHAVAAMLAATSVLGFTFSQRRTSRRSSALQQQGLVRFDNSLQQIESDLKDILARLHGSRLRSVVVLEELDKLDDRRGAQLDAVIRYFKNLFTQAPALFFFLTDKAYFDLISSRVKRARRERSYAVEHTFFTHRIFVGRPTTSDCLRYLERVMANEEGAARVRSYHRAAAGGRDGEDRLLPLIGAVLFSAANHLFDLKNELRRHVKTTGAETTLALDKESFPDDQAALAKFQELIERKAHQYAFGPAQTYANEILHDCLYSVFNELGSSEPQKVSDFHPRVDNELLLDEQLDIGKREGIKEAVASLLDDLREGGAFHAEKTQLASGSFVWSTAAARSFHFVRRLEPYEVEFVETLGGLGRAAALFGSNGPMVGLGPSPDEADALAAALAERTSQVRELRQSLGKEDAEIEKKGFQRAFRGLEQAAQAAQLRVLTEHYGLVLKPVPARGRAASVYLLGTQHESPREWIQGATVFLQGDVEDPGSLVREIVEGHPKLRRLGVVEVMNAGADQSAIASRQRWWAESMSRLAVVDGARVPIASRASVIGLGQAGLERALPQDPPAADWTRGIAWEREASELLLSACWAGFVHVGDASFPTTGLGRTGGVIFRGWRHHMADAAPMLWLKPTSAPGLALNEVAPALRHQLMEDGERETVLCIVSGSTMDATDLWMAAGTELWTHSGGRQVMNWALRRPAALAMSSPDLILAVTLPSTPDPQIEPLLKQLADALKARQARAVVVADTLPDVLQDVPMKTAEPYPPQPEA